MGVFNESIVVGARFHAHIWYLGVYDTGKKHRKNLRYVAHSSIHDTSYQYLVLGVHRKIWDASPTSNYCIEQTHANNRLKERHNNNASMKHVST